MNRNLVKRVWSVQSVSMERDTEKVEGGFIANLEVYS